MKKNIYLIIFLTTLSIITTGCPENDLNLHMWVINKSDSDVFYYIALEQKNNNCPDTVLPVKKYGNTLKKGYPKKEYFAPPTCDSIRVFILSVDTLNKYSWEQIRKDNNILRRYDFTVNDLPKMNWEITYP